MSTKACVVVDCIRAATTNELDEFIVRNLTTGQVETVVVSGKFYSDYYKYPSDFRDEFLSIFSDATIRYTMAAKRKISELINFNRRWEGAPFTPDLL